MVKMRFNSCFCFFYLFLIFFLFLFLIFCFVLFFFKMDALNTTALRSFLFPLYLSSSAEKKKKKTPLLGCTPL
jgi:hypothetical protein